MSASEPVARLNFRLPAEIKQVIEEAAAQSGQTVSDFAISTLVHAARQIVREQQTLGFQCETARFSSPCSTVRPPSRTKR